MATFEEKLFHKILKNNLVWELGGHENAMFDGDITEQEFKDMLTIENVMSLADNEMKRAYTRGYLESDSTTVAIEAKHLKFMGTERIEHIKNVAVRNALKQFE